MKPITVVLADDYFYVVDGLQPVVDRAEDLKVIGTVSSLPMIKPVIAETQPDVLVLDIAWPGDEYAGIKLIPQIRAAHPNTQIVAITAHSILIQSAKEVCPFVLEKGFSQAQLLDTIRWAAQSNIDPPVIPSKAKDPVLFSDLTKREIDVLRCVSLGMTNKEIGLELHISVGTVKKHVSNIYSKLGVTNRAEATAIAVQHHLS